MTLSLPADILLVMLSHLDVKDVVKFRKVSKDFYGLSKSRSVWYSLLRRCIIEEDIPLPGLAGRSLESLDAEELEGLLRRALDLRRNWHSDSPVIRRSVQFASPDAQIVRMNVLFGRTNDSGRRWLVTLTKPAHARIGVGAYTVRCWDVCQAHPVCVAQREFERFGGMAISKMSGDTDCIAVLTPRGIDILSIVGNATNPSGGFVTSKTISVPMTMLHYFQDRRVITMDSKGGLFLIDIDYPQVKIEFQHSSEPPAVDFVLTDTFILILKCRTLELYPLPSSIAAVPTHIIIPPIFVYQWPRPAGFGVMNFRRPFGIKSVNDPIVMFIRFGSLTLPGWSSNTIYQYEIRPNSYFVSSERPSEMNVPYEYPPVLIGEIVAPIDYRTPTDLALGAYGTVVWLDDDAYGDRHGQRIGGAYARVSERRREEGDDGDDDGESDDEASSDTSISEEASFIFGVLDGGGWTNLAVDEQEGVIFLGRSSGVIDMFEYA